MSKHIQKDITKGESCGGGRGKVRVSGVPQASLLSPATTEQDLMILKFLSSSQRKQREGREKSFIETENINDR